jgi:hypothetical protein
MNLQSHPRVQILFAAVVFLAATAGHEASASEVIGLNLSNFNAPKDAAGNYAYVTKSLTESGGSTTVDFVVSGAVAGTSIDEFGFNTSSSVPTLTASNFHLYQGSTTGGTPLTFTLQTPGNMDGFGSFKYDIGGGSFSSNTSQTVLVELIYTGTSNTLADFDVKNANGNEFAAHLKAPGATGFVSGPSTPAVPEPASLATAGLGVLMGLGYAWRRRKQAVG